MGTVGYKLFDVIYHDHSLGCCKDLSLGVYSSSFTSMTWCSRSAMAAKLIFFADDIALYRIIYSPSDYDNLQSDIDAVSSCFTSKYFSLNARKCGGLYTRLLSQPLTLGDDPLTLKSIASYRYLGVLIISTLMS